MLRRISKVIGGVTLCATAVVTGTVAADAAPENEAAPNVAVVSTRFDKLTYQPGDLASVSYKFTNRGSIDAVKVANYAGGNGDSWELQVTDWGGVRFDEGITIPAGETVTVVLRGVVSAGSWNAGRVTIAYGFIAENGDSDESDNSGVARASVPGATASMQARIVHDANSDHRTDPGEGVAGVKVAVVGLYDIEHIEAKYSDQDGVLRFTGLPVGEYEVRVSPPAGWWMVRGSNVTHSEVRLPGMASLSMNIEPVA